MSRLMVVVLSVWLCLLALPSTALNNTDCPKPTATAPPPFEYEFELDEDLGEIFSSQIVDYLNTTGSTEGLVEAIGELSNSEWPWFDAQAFEVDINADGEQNVLVNVNLRWSGSYDSVLMVFSCSDAAYETASTLTDWEAFDGEKTPPTTIIAISDMNNNQRPEIVQRQGWDGRRFYELVTVYEWNDGELVEVLSTGYSLGSFDSVELRDVDSDNTTLELVVGDRWGYGQATAWVLIEIERWRPIEVTYA